MLTNTAKLMPRIHPSGDDCKETSLASREGPEESKAKSCTYSAVDKLKLEFASMNPCYHIVLDLILINLSGLIRQLSFHRLKTLTKMLYPAVL
jgi:hypothetical protein